MHCPCSSGLSYEVCCEPFHKGKFPDHPLQLMRSRYSAYALKLPIYIIETTHPQNPHYEKNRIAWAKSILEFCEGTTFERLEIVEAREEGDRGWVTFTAHLKQGGQEASFTEESEFERVAGRWLYLKGKVKRGKKF